MFDTCQVFAEILCATRVEEIKLKLERRDERKDFTGEENSKGKGTVGEAHRNKK